MTSDETIFARREAAAPRGFGNATGIIAARAENAELRDVGGNRHASGIAVLNTGRRHPRVIAAVPDRLDRFTHTAFQATAYEPSIALAERLSARAGLILLSCGIFGETIRPPAPLTTPDSHLDEGLGMLGQALGA